MQLFVGIQLQEIHQKAHIMVHIGMLSALQRIVPSGQLHNDLVDDRARSLAHCLLYTSPSPRDS